MDYCAGTTRFGYRYFWQHRVSNYLRQGGYVFIGVVYLFVRRRHWALRGREAALTQLNSTGHVTLTEKRDREGKKSKSL